MYLGLDLRGGVHFLLQVDMKAALDKAADRYTTDIRSLMREKKIVYSGVGPRRLERRAAVQAMTPSGRARGTRSPTHFPTSPCASRKPPEANRGSSRA